MYYRSKFLKTLNHDKVLVKFIDYGCEQETFISDLLDLERASFDLATIPSQAICVQLACTKSLTGRDIVKIRDLVLEQNVLVKLANIPKGSEPTVVELLKRSQSDGTLSSVNKIINESRTTSQTLLDPPSRKKSYVVSLENTLSRNLPTPNIPPEGSYFNVFVTLAAHPGLFCVSHSFT